MRLRSRLILTAALLAASTQGRAEPAPGPVSVAGVTLVGDGCPANTTAVDVAPDGSAFTVLFGSYVASAGGPAGKGQQWRSCLIDLTLATPAPYTFTLESVDFRGYASLDGGTLAEQVSTLSFPPRPSFVRLASLELAPPLDDDYEHHVDVPVLYQVSAPCVGATRRLQLRINSGVTSRSGAPALLTVDSVDGVLTQSYRLRWRACPGARR